MTSQPHGNPSGHPPGPQHGHKLSTWRFALRVIGLLAKGFGALFAVLLLGVFALYFSLPYIVNGDRVKTMLVDQLQKTLHRPVRIQRVILTPQGVKLTQFQVLDADGKAPFIEGDFALITIKLPKLLQKRVELSNVRLASPRIHVTRDAQGRWSFEDIFESTAAARPAGPPKAFELPISLAADVTAIESGSLDVDDQLRGTRYLIDDFNLTVQQFDLDAPFAYKVAFKNVNTFGERKISMAISAQGSMALASFDWPRAFLKADRADVSLDGRDIQGSVSVSSFTAPVVEADLSLPPLGKDDWNWAFGKPVDFSLPASRLRGRLFWLEPRKVRVQRVEASAGDLTAAGSGTLDLTGKQPQLSAELSSGDFPLEEAASLRPPLQRYDLRGAAMAEASVSGWPGRWKVAKAHLRLRGTAVRFAHWRVVDGNADLTATKDFSDLAVTLSSGAVEAYNNSFGDITLALSIIRKDLRVEYLSLKWDDARVRLRGRVVNLPDPRDVWLSGSVDHVHWERASQLVQDVIASVSTRTATGETTAAEDDDSKQLWVQTFKYAIPRKFPDTIGHIHIGRVLHKNFSFADTDLMWDLRGVTKQLNTVNGEIRASFGPGRVNDIQAVQDSNKFLSIVFLPYIYMYKMNSLSVLSTAQAYPKELDFNRIEGQYGIHRGVVSTRFFSVDSPQLLAFASGTADFGHETVDMNILTRLTNLRATLPEWWVDEKGRPAIGFRVKGDLNRPDLEPRLHKIGADEIENDLEAARGGAKARFDAIDKLAQLEAPLKPKVIGRKP